MPSPPVRKFAPTPVETTTRSSKQKEPQPSDQSQVTKPQRFVPEAVETTIRSSRDVRPNSPESGDLQTLKHQHKTRRFAPEPTETATRSSRDKKEDGEKPKPRRFAVQPVETTQRSSKDKKQEVPQIKFTPQLLETTFSSTKDRGSQSSTDSAKSARKFAPVLINTARRSRKAGDVKSAIAVSDKTEQGFSIAAREHRRHITGTATPMEVDDDENPEKGGPLDLMAIDEAELRPVSPFDGSSRRQRSQQRQHSFRCPDLDTIESSESDRESDTSSSPPDVNQGSPITASDSSFNEYKHATRIRESIDENFANYFLQLEAKRAQKRLQEQALAAFPNSDFHEPVQHYVNDERDSDSDESIDYRPVTYDEDEDNTAARAVRRESTKVPWEQLEMQRHAERLDQERKANQITAAHSPGGPWWNPEYNIAQPDAEMQSMRDRARPPMLGSDITFTRCQSPEPARFDVTQGSTALRNQMCYLSEHADSQDKSDAAPALWSGPEAEHSDSIQSTVTSASTTSKGLWGGFCTDDAKKLPGGLAVPVMPSGLITPRQESLNPFDQSFSFTSGIEMSGVAVQTPPTPASSDGRPQTIDGVLGADRELDNMIEQEFPDSFVTQVYNYLSLGYPSLARPFDTELCKISRMSVSELRQDDQKARATPRGYIRLGPDFEGGGGIESAENCRRWVALKTYIREWARQEKTMSNFDGPGGNFATTARRGSWGN